MQLPTALGIGAPRSGSTWVHDRLAAHPQVTMARGRKEAHFFDRHYDRGLAWYAGLFDGSSSPCRAEVSPSYMHEELIGRRIHAVIPEVRLVAILRNPVDRAYSQYKFHVRERGMRIGFRDYLDHNPDALERGLYHRQLVRFMTHFAPEQLLVLLLEDVERDPGSATRILYEFVGVDPSFRASGGEVRPNEARVPRMHGVYVGLKRVASALHRHNLSGAVHLAKRLGVRQLFLPPGNTGFRALDPDVRRQLWPHFRDDVTALSRMLERDLHTLWSPDIQR